MKKPIALAKSATKKFVQTKLGYKLIAEDFATDKASVDFIFEDEQTNKLIFVDVLLKNKEKETTLADVRSYVIKRKMFIPLVWYTEKHKITDMEARIDVCEIDLTADKAKVKYFKGLV